VISQVKSLAQISESVYLSLKINLINNFDFYFTPYFNCREIKLAKYLDPRCKLTFEADKNLARNLLKDEYTKFKVKFSEQRDDGGNGKHDLISGLNEIIVEETTFNEVDNYIRETLIGSSENIYQYWKTKELQYPILSGMSKFLLCIMPTSVDVERMASEEGNILTNKRSTMKPEMLEILVLSKAYLKKYEKNIID
jgi:hypothetical protein